MLLSKEVSTDEKIYFKHLYDYKNIEDSENTESQRIGTIINKEEIVLINETIVFTYEYDSSGLLKRIYENDVLSKVYEYNYKNELIAENDYINKKANEYMISSNGNIDFIYKTDYETISNTKVYSFEYNNQYSKDILTKITKDGIINSVTYNESYFANPTSINLGGTNLILEWTGPKLTKAHLNNNEYVEYKYDALGNRIEKNVITTILESIERKYFYENGKLIREKYIDNRKGDEVYKYFDYDANGLLLSITINNTKYYYIRYIFNTIIGLIDVNGNLIVRYHYDAYGNIIKIDGNSNLAYLNPFIYKGYYYDEETQLFYCYSRYYSPELCRFISPDSIEYLDPESINGLNLYCYCFNNPIMYSDPSGHFPWLLLAAVLLFTPIGGTALQAVASVGSYVVMSAWALGDLVFNNGEGAWANMCSINWNPFNSDESATLNSNYVSFYVGVPVFRTNMSRPGSFSIIFLPRGRSENALRHERGHNSQLMMMGIANYGVGIGIPSLFMLGPWAAQGGDNYYRAPWEITADKLGGVSRTVHTQEDIDYGWWYLKRLIGFPFISPKYF